MFKLDDDFLKELGLDSMPEDQKQPFLQHIYSELELKVGTKLSDGMSEAQLEEFEKIIDRDQVAVDEWLARYVPNFQSDEAFSKLMQATGLESSDVRLRSEYAASKWLEVNRPDYRQVVTQVLEDLKKEILTNRSALLGQQQPPQSPAV